MPAGLRPAHSMNLKVSARSRSTVLRRECGSERLRRNRIELNRGGQARWLWGSIAVPLSWRGIGGCSDASGSVAFDDRGYFQRLQKRRLKRRPIVEVRCGHTSSMRFCDRLSGDSSAGTDHEVSSLCDRRWHGPGRISMMIMGPRQQGHGIAAALASAADVSSPGLAVAAAVAAARDPRMMASFALRCPLARKP